MTLVPQGGRMCLLDRVIGWSAREIQCAARSHRDADNPLRRGDTLSAVHLVEYAAQAMAAHGALGAHGRAQPGMLAALRDVHLTVASIHDIEEELIVVARRLVAQNDGSLYEFDVTAGARRLCAGRIAIALRS